jgi:hypothetical protein
MSETYATTAMGAGDAVELHVVGGADHMDVIDPQSKAWELVVKDIDRLMS